MVFKTAIFDLDGTLLDTLRDIAQSVNYALEVNNLQTRPIDEIKSFIGNGILNLIDQSVPKNSTKAQKSKVLQNYMTHYALHKKDNSEPFDGIMELLDNLKEKGVNIAILSNKDDKPTKELAKEVFTNTVCYAKGYTNDMPPKPAPDGIYHILDIINEKLENCIFIGDSDVDIQTGKNAGIYTVGVSWGFREFEELIQNGADKIVHKPSEILELF